LIQLSKSYLLQVGIDTGISCLKRAHGLARCTSRGPDRDVRLGTNITIAAAPRRLAQRSGAIQSSSVTRWD